MTLQNIIERIVQVFPTLGWTQIIKEIDLAQKEFVEETEILWTQYQLPSITSAKTFNLPSNFIRLIRIDYLNSNDEAIYDPLLDHVEFGKISFDSMVETITSIPATIDKIIIVYVYKPSNITVYTDSLEIPEEFYDAILAKCMERLHARFPNIPILDERGRQIGWRADWAAVKYWKDEYVGYRIKGKKYRNLIDISPMRVSMYTSPGDLPQFVVGEISDGAMTAVTSTSAYRKYLRFTAVSGVITINSTGGLTGWTTAPTAIDDGVGTITVTSSAEFEPTMWIKPNNQMVNYDYVDTSTIKLYPPIGYGTIVVEIFNYE